MAATAYEFSIQADFPNHKVDTGRLTKEILSSTMVALLDGLTTLERIETVAVACFVWFRSAISAEDEILLDGIVAVHSGEPLPALVERVHLDTPETSDGKPIFLTCSFPGDVMLYEAGRGDDLTTGVRGDGEVLKFSSSTVEEPYKEIRFRDYIYLIGGQVQFLGGDVDDGVDFQVDFPATVVTSTPGTGNVNISSYKLIPAPGNDGSHTLNMTEKYGANVGFLKAVPVPSSTQTGRFNYDDENHILTTAPDADGAYNLYTVPLSQIRQVREIPILGSGQINLTFENIKAKKMLPQWVLKITLHNRSGSAVKVRAFLITGRKTTV